MTAYLNHSSDFKRELATSTTTATSTASSTLARKNIDYKRNNGAVLAPRFIFECAIKLNMKPLTSATAAIIFHRFFREVENETYDEYVKHFTLLYRNEKRHFFFVQKIIFLKINFSNFQM